MSLRVRRNDMAGVVAGEDLSSYRNCFVVFGSSAADVTTVVHWTSGTPVGILQNAPQQGEPAEVAMVGGGAYLKMTAANATAPLFFKADTGGAGTAATDGANLDVGFMSLEINTQVGSYVEGVVVTTTHG
jgi:hypothetical protein